MTPTGPSASENLSPRTNRGPLAAAENRRALIEAARLEFAEHGASVPLSRIAARAGVGQGSLYRHFSDRVQLATDVFSENLEQLSREVSCAQQPYEVFMARLEHQASEASALVEIVSGQDSTDQSTSLRDQLRDLVAQVHDSGCSTGDVSERSSVEDLMTAASMFALAVAKAPPQDRAATATRARRIIDRWFLHSLPLEK